MLLYKKYKHNIAPVHLFEINTLIDQTILVGSLGSIGKIQISNCDCLFSLFSSDRSSRSCNRYLLVFECEDEIESYIKLLFTFQAYKQHYNTILNSTKI